MKKIIIASLILLTLLVAGCTTQPVQEEEQKQELERNICTEEQKQAEVCTMEYRPVCGNNDKTYSNPCMACSSGEINSWVEGECIMSLEEALEIADGSECTEQGTVGTDGFYNTNSKTWWLDFEPFEEKQGCNPACIVWEQTKEVEINWRCTGLLPE